jgi:two-component system response regulator WspF
LNERSTLPGRVAVEGERPQAGHVLLSGKDAHLTFGHDGRISYQTQPADCIYRPSIDLFFESAIGHWNGKMIAVVLTGMGRDGARGMKALREAGAFTIATVLALPQIAPAINELVSKSSTTMFARSAQRGSGTSCLLS